MPEKLAKETPKETKHDYNEEKSIYSSAPTIPIQDDQPFTPAPFYKLFRVWPAHLQPESLN
jgi:hypothetical protein